MPTYINYQVVSFEGALSAVLFNPDSDGDLKSERNEIGINPTTDDIEMMESVNPILFYFSTSG